eukprot:TRINITY_DN47910_c0_g1_i1.p1 TRINITY_DN47910_c0_g1~~TRINITY_DN47910_c0_g1_i1.p1  ORF type:complete len:584 (-),score=71.79 TRINITY_DN47910_c0_g1_i1:300-1826(-)
MATLYQLVAVKVSHHGLKVTIPRCPHIIDDHPAFVYRGLLLDVSRSYHPLSSIKELIVRLAEFKINVLHLHLTDTNAWPLEVEGFPKVAEMLSYRDLSGRPLTYSRSDVRELVEFARLRGMSLVPEIDGPAHAPALATGAPFHLTVAAGREYSNNDWSREPPPGTWNISDAAALAFVRTALRQVEEDFSTSPFLHLGGDEPTAGGVCATLTNATLKESCFKQCTSLNGSNGSRFSLGCLAVPKSPVNTNVTWWFPELLNQVMQKYFDTVNPDSARIPKAAWANVATENAVRLPPTGLDSKSMLQVWVYPPPAASAPAVTEEHCREYDLIQNSATFPYSPIPGSPASTRSGWLFLDCGMGSNWISMRPNFWCPHASWQAIYALNLTQGYGPALKTRACQRAFIGGEMAFWGDITGPGNAMPIIFPRIVAFAERAWSNPPAVMASEMVEGRPPAWYWHQVLKEALARLNNVVANFNSLGLGVSQLQPEFCREHPEYCTEYTNDEYAPRNS